MAARMLETLAPPQSSTPSRRLGDRGTGRRRDTGRNGGAGGAHNRPADLSRCRRTLVTLMQPRVRLGWAEFASVETESNAALRRARCRHLAPGASHS
jgi:hypothetical protein